jgi:hypothetical protein
MSHPGNGAAEGGNTTEAAEEGRTTWISDANWKRWSAMEGHQIAKAKFVISFLFKGGCTWQHVRDFAAAFLTERIRGTIVGASVPKESVQAERVGLYTTADPLMGPL